jgi:hypothetical protein
VLDEDVASCLVRRGHHVCLSLTKAVERHNRVIQLKTADEAIGGRQKSPWNFTPHVRMLRTNYTSIQQLFHASHPSIPFFIAAFLGLLIIFILPMFRRTNKFPVKGRVIVPPASCP